MVQLQLILAQTILQSKIGADPFCFLLLNDSVGHETRCNFGSVQGGVQVPPG